MCIHMNLNRKETETELTLTCIDCGDKRVIPKMTKADIEEDRKRFEHNQELKKSNYSRT